MFGTNYVNTRVDLTIILTLSLFLPLISLLSHSVGHDEWIYYRTIEITKFENIVSLIEPHNNILGFITPRYLLSYPIFDIVNKLTFLPIFWIHYIILIPPTFIIVKWIKTNGSKLLHSFLVFLALAYFLTYPNFYNTGLLFLLSSLHAKKYLRLILFFFGCCLHPIAFFNGIILLITPFWKGLRIISIFLLLLIISISIFYSHYIYEKFNAQLFQENILEEIEEKKDIQDQALGDRKLQELEIGEIRDKTKIKKKEDVVEEKIIYMPEYKSKKLPRHKITKNRGFLPFFVSRARMSTRNLISTFKDRSVLFWVVIISFVFFRGIKTKIGNIIMIIPILLFAHATSLSAVGQAKNGGPGIFLIKSMFINNASDYIWFPKDQLFWKTMYNKEVSNITLGSKLCVEKNRELLSISSPFINTVDFRPFKDKVGENCLPEYFERNSISFYGIRYKKNSITEECINSYIPIFTRLSGDERMDPPEIIAFFTITSLPNGEYFITGSNKGSINTNISNISQMSMHVANCVIAKNTKG